jgi:hypothetical protein
MDNNEKPAPVAWGLLSPALDPDWTPPDAEPEPTNVVNLDDYRGRR